MSASSAVEADALVESFLRDHPDFALHRAAWILRPMISQAYFTSPTTSVEEGSSRGLPLLVRRRVRASAAALRRVRRVAVWEAEGALYIAETINERRTLSSVSLCEPTAHRALEFRTNRLHVREQPPGGGAVRELGTLIGDSIGLPTNLAALFVDQSSLVRAFAVADRSYRAASQFIGRTRPRTLVVATQQNVLVRAAILAARDLGIPTVYFPHAPVASVPWYEDLPTDYAGLRGAGEADFYAALGVDRSRLDVVGVPAIGNAELPDIDADLPSLVALSPIDPSSLRRFIDTTAEAIPEAVVVPHPRQSPTVVKRIIPGSWSIAVGRPAFELLRQGYPRVVLHNSGVAWESLRLGVPTIHIDLHEGGPSYAMYKDGAIDVAGSSAELSTLVRRPVPANEERQLLTEAAVYWGGPLGAESRSLARELVLRAQREGLSGRPIADRWAIDGR